MNCHEFRAQWDDNTDNEILSHIETCEECMAWLEQAWANSEEALFMQENPHPSAELENNIMNQIYALPSDKDITPLAAAREAKEATVETKRKKRFSLFAYPLVGAAGVLLVVGLVGVQALNGGLFTFGGEKSASQVNAELQQADNSPAPSAFQSPTTEPADRDQPASPDAPVSNQIAVLPTQDTDKNSVAKNDKASPGSTMKRSETHALQEKDTAQNKKAQQPAEPKQSAETKNPTDSTVAVGPQLPANQSTAVTEPATVPDTPSIAAGADQPTANQSSSEQEAALSNRLGLTSLPIEENNTATAKIAPDTEAGKETQQTFSAFTSEALASQASDMPIAKITAGDYKLQTLNVNYESETSKHVISQNANYSGSSGLVKLEVQRNEEQRALSIPGTFTNAPQIFNIGPDKAIGVTFEGNTEHAVHFMTTKSGQPLYIMITGKGMSLQQLMDMAKSIQWS
ncbi:hypothetical protein [Brevibacillus daliensis]|uniref:hypothetical protein n=1 Tax=Brevibacillus daliensis TaxID=2892995 RepID=UPI001E57EC20|nr:hypothetical protein [Brevibacillus daliensis]